MKKTSKRRPGIVIMGQLIGLVKPLLPVMLLSIMLGVNGFLCAISLTILASAKLIEGLADSLSSGGVMLEGAVRLPLATGSFFMILFLVAVLRGVLHYGEQYCNHFIAFKLLAIVRHKVFANLRRLCPAKLEGKDRGDLISIITSDIELLEVFYAHTISPIAIAVIVSIFMTAFIGRQNALAGLLALIAYLTVGVVIPLAIGRAGGERGLAFRNGFGELNSYVLDSIRGVDETIQYDGGEMRRKDIADRSVRLSKLQRGLAGLEATQTSLTNAAILIFSFVMLFFMMYEYKEGNVTFSNVLLATVSMMGSFGPVLALSNLANSLNQTLAAGERVLSILEEKPQVVEVTDGIDVEKFEGVGAYGVTFAYGGENILSDYTIEIPKGKVVGIYGASGSGKSTLLRLLMRFWDVGSGQIRLSGVDVREINTASLRDMESYVEQESYLFHDSIANNIAIGRLDASREEIVEAAKKASIHEFIMTLPDGYDTKVGELGDTLSGGERQRIGIARAFLHDAPLMLLDEPTSNLDSLNEGIILKSLADAMTSGEKTVLLVSHRKSTLSIADRIYKMESGRLG
jgi:ATP-binding cassette subfamily C protein